MSLHSYLSIEASELSLGDSVRSICPHCGGGSQREESLVITRTEGGGLLYVCHRASCGTKGAVNVHGGHLHGRERTAQEAPRKTRRSFTGNTTELPDTIRDKVKALWGISDPPYWYWTGSYGGRIAMSVRSPKYTHRGWVLRDIRGRSSVKALTYIDEGEEGLSWYRNHPHAPTVVVEDIPSAVRASRYVNSVALLGTGVGLPRAGEIEQYGTRPIIMALDQDATALSFRLARRYAALWGDVEVLMLDKDIKDMEEQAVKELFEKYDART